MAVSRKSNTKTQISPGANSNETPAERYLNKYALSHQDPVNKVIHLVCVPLAMFGLFGLLWAIPFPHLKFLGIYNGYFNWVSFAIAIAVYYYLRISPMMSYAILFIMLGFSYLIMTLLSWQTSGGPAMWLICVVIFVPSVCFMLYGNAREKTFAQYGLNLTSLPLAPAHLLYKLLKIARING